MTTEITTKLARIAEYLDRHNLDALLFRQRNNFAWITAGRDNRIPNSQSAGVASILVTRDSRTCVTNNIEAGRMEEEELKDTGISTVSYPWHDRSAAAKVAKELLGDKRLAPDRIAADTDHGGDFGEVARAFKPLGGSFNELRWSLTNEEIARYREGGRRASAAMERACRNIRPGMTEHEIAGLLDHEINASGCTPTVTLIASDDRIRNFRHPIAKDKKAADYVMLVTCASFGGLISNLTRFVSFKPLAPDLAAKQQAICNVDATVNLATKPGRTFGEIFTDLQKAYATNNHPDEWQFHHQGGSTGYNGRDVFATPASNVKVRDNQAFAWNPSITGVKSEDTVLCTAKGIEVLTAASKDWPQLPGHSPAGDLARPNVLVL